MRITRIRNIFFALAALSLPGLSGCGEFFAPRVIEEGGPVVHRPALSLNFAPLARAVQQVATGNAQSDGDEFEQGTITIDTASLRENLEVMLNACGVDSSDWTSGYTGNSYQKASWISNTMKFTLAGTTSASLSHGGGTFNGVNPYVYTPGGTSVVDRYFSLSWNGANNLEKWTDALADRRQKYADFVGIDQTGFDPDTDDPTTGFLPLHITAREGVRLTSTEIDAHKTSLYGLLAMLTYYKESFDGSWTYGNGSNNDDDEIITAAIEKLVKVAEQFYLGVYPDPAGTIDVPNGSALIDPTA